MELQYILFFGVLHGLLGVIGATLCLIISVSMRRKAEVVILFPFLRPKKFIFLMRIIFLASVLSVVFFSLYVMSIYLHLYEIALPMSVEDLISMFSFVPAAFFVYAFWIWARRFRV